MEEEGLNPATETFEVEDAKSTPDPLSQILEKLVAADKHFTNLATKANQQKEHLAAITAKVDQQSAKADQQHEDLAVLSARMEQHFSALTAQINQQQAHFQCVKLCVFHFTA